MLADDVSAFVEAMTPRTDETFAAMAAENVANDVPIVGPAVGGALRVLARLGVSVKR